MTAQRFADHQAEEIHRRGQLITKLRNRLHYVEKSRDRWRRHALALARKEKR